MQLVDYYMIVVMVMMDAHDYLTSLMELGCGQVSGEELLLLGTQRYVIRDHDGAPRRDALDKRHHEGRARAVVQTRKGFVQ